MYSTVPPWLQHTPSLIGTITGAPGMAFPHIQLGSGIAHGSVTGALHQMAPSLGILPAARVFVTAFINQNLAYFCGEVNPFWEKCVEVTGEAGGQVAITRGLQKGI